MNKQGIDYLLKVNELKKKYGFGLPSYNWSDSVVQERIMRLGREARDFELNVNDHNELERVAIATLHYDILNNYA